MAKAPLPQRSEIWTVQFDPSVGAEIRKIRPAVVVSVDTVGRLPLRIVVPLTDWQDAFALLPWFVPIRAPFQRVDERFRCRRISGKVGIREPIPSPYRPSEQPEIAAIASAVALCVGIARMVIGLDIGGAISRRLTHAARRGRSPSHSGRNRADCRTCCAICWRSCRRRTIWP